MSKLLCVMAAIALAATSVSVEAKGGGSHASQQSGKSSASTLRGGNNNDQKGGRYLARSLKKLPGKKKPPTLTLKRGKNQTE